MGEDGPIDMLMARETRRRCPKNTVALRSSSLLRCLALYQQGRPHQEANSSGL